MKFVWLVEGAFYPSGAYHQQVYLLSDYLHNFGIESAVANPSSLQEQSGEVLEKLRAYEPDVIVTFGDVHPFGLAEQLDTPLLSWFIWGHHESAAMTVPDGLPPCVTFAAASDFAMRALQELDIPSLYVPHAYDLNIFHPGRRASARGRLGWDFTEPVVAMVSVNYAANALETEMRGFELPDRKNWQGALEAFAGLLELRPETRLYAHTNATGACDIMDEADRLRIIDQVTLADQTHFHHGTWDYPQSYLADVYRASNVLLYPSLAEGFGVPLIEAQACGIPVVTTNSGPMTELARTGTAVVSAPDPVLSSWRRPDTGALTTSLDFWLGSTVDPNRTHLDVAQFAVEAVVEDCFIPALEAAAGNRP